MLLNEAYHLLHAYLEDVLVFHCRSKLHFAAVGEQDLPGAAYLAQHADLEAFSGSRRVVESQLRNFAVAPDLAVLLEH